MDIPVPGREYTMQLFADHLIHAWDLARAIGVDERLDAGLVASCATWSERWRMRTAARVRSRRGHRCPVMRTPRWCCWLVSAGTPESCCQRYSPRPRCPEFGDPRSIWSSRATHGRQEIFGELAPEK